MRELSTKAFLKAMDECLEKQVDFILFAGDLFNTSLPSVDILNNPLQGPIDANTSSGIADPNTSSSSSVLESKAASTLKHTMAEMIRNFKFGNSEIQIGMNMMLHDRIDIYFTMYFCI